MQITVVDSFEEDVAGKYAFTKSLERRLEREKDLHSKSVLTGQVDSYEGYKYRVGIIQGLNLAIKHLKELKGE